MQVKNLLNGYYLTNFSLYFQRLDYAEQCSVWSTYSHFGMIVYKMQIYYSKNYFINFNKTKLLKTKNLKKRFQQLKILNHLKSWKPLQIKLKIFQLVSKKNFKSRTPNDINSKILFNFQVTFCIKKSYQHNKHVIFLNDHIRTLIFLVFSIRKLHFKTITIHNNV